MSFLGINLGNLGKQLMDWGGDYDIIDGLSVRGGDRSAVNNAFIGKTAQNSGAPAPQHKGTGGQNSGSNQPSPITWDQAQAAGMGSVAATDQRDRDMTIGNIDQQIAALNNQYGGLDTQSRTGLQYIEDAYNKGTSRLNQQQSSALSRYATQRGDTRRDFANTDEDIDSNARNSFNMMQSVLGRHGAGSSSASTELVPYAVANDASKTRGKVADSYAINLRDLQTAEDDTKTQYKNSVADLSDQRKQNQYNLDKDVTGKRAEIQNQLASLQAQRVQAQNGNWQQARDAMAGNVSLRDALTRTLNGLSEKYRSPYKVDDVVAKEAKLRNYAIDPSGVSVEGGNGTGYDTDTSAEYLAQMKKAEEDKRKQPLV
jgi:hypothetical protein